jgi:hypothetical protein
MTSLLVVLNTYLVYATIVCSVSPPRPVELNSILFLMLVCIYYSVVSVKREMLQLGRCVLGACGAFFGALVAMACELRVRLSFAVDANKMGDGAVVGAFSFRREEAARQFSHAPVILYAFAAFTLV